MNDLLKYTYTLIMLCLTSSSFGQCLADFDYDDSSLVIAFSNQSQHNNNDSIISYNWDFGDSGTSDNASPLHIYNESGAYDVSLNIETEAGCMDTIIKSIYICTFNLDYDLQIDCDEDNKVSLDLHILDTYSSAGEINVFLDGELVNDIPLTTTNDTVSIETELLADGQEHTIDIQSINHPSCILSEIFEVNACVPPCYLTDLKANITNNKNINAFVTELGYNPQVLNVTTGDTITFTWTTDDRSVTSNPNNNVQNWDSGILNNEDEYKLYSYSPGIFSYTSSNAPSGFIDGSLVSTCPDSAYYDLLLTFQNEQQSGAYDLWIDGVPSYISGIPYNLNGFDTIYLTLPGDGILHTYEVFDAVSPSCYLSTSVQAPVCGINSECNLSISATQTTPCDQDSIVDVTFTILSAGGGINGFDLYIDEELFETNITYTGTETIITRSLFGDSEEHSIKILDTATDTCIATSNILLEDCSQPCLFLNAFAGVGSDNSFVANVLNDSYSPKDITISAGDRVIWQWQTDTLRSVTSFDFSFDSGINGPGASYTSPTLPVGVHRYYSDFNGMEGSITVEPNCENDLIPIVYNFNKFGGANTGYNIFVDSIKVNNVPIAYADNGNNSGNSFVDGNGELHQVQIIDAVDNTCNETITFLVPFCDESTCALFLENPTFSDCNDNNTIGLTIDVLSYNSIDSLFLKIVDGIVIDTLEFDTTGITSIDFNLPGDGNLHEITVTDLSEELCTATSSLMAPMCNNPCTFSPIGIEYIPESATDSCFDGSVQLIVTTQAIHSFNSDYIISLSSESIDINQTHNYPSDGYITHFFTLPANGELIDIEFSNIIETSCVRDTSFNMYSCDPDPCILSLINLSFGDCKDGGLMDMTIEIDTFRITDSLSILIDNEEIFSGSYDDFYATPGFEIADTGEERKLNLIDIENDKCTSENLFFTPFCSTDCIIDVSYMLSDSCILAEDSTYNIILLGTVLNAVSDSILVNLVGSNNSFYHSYDELANGITLTISRAEDNPTLGIFDLLDDSCRKFIEVDPPACILDCNISIENAMIIEEDCINGIRKVAFDISYGYQDADSIVLLVDGAIIQTDLYPTDSLITTSILGDGMVHKVIIRDLSNELCADTLDLLVTACEFSCVDFLVDFDIVIDSFTNTATFNDLTTGNPNNWSWNLGDGTVSSNSNPFHTYSDFGVYTICLTVENEEEGCIQYLCQDIELIDIGCDADFSYSVDGLTVSFQSVSTPLESINDLVWTIDGDTILENVINSSYTATESQSIELCLSIATITNCMSTSCDTIDLVDPCNISPLFDTLISFDTIQLVNTSLGEYTSTSWSFGNGITLTGNEVEYIYPQDGDYEVCMTVSNSAVNNCEFTICQMITIIGCKANFSYSVDGLTVSFQSLSPPLEAINDLVWTIDGDTIAENVINSSYTATESESIELCLSVATITDCFSSICDTIELVELCNISPLFDTLISFDTIQLVNTSLGNYTSTSWTFGNGTTFTGNEVEYIYPQDGDYEVCMTVSNSEANNCEFTICQMITINSCNLDATFLININQDTLNAELIAPNDNLVISWDFGNGFSANIDPVQFVYPDVGDYTICATVTDINLDNCIETQCEEISIVLTDIKSELLTEIDVYPNPIQIGENVRIVNNERRELSIELYTAAGQKLNISIIDQGDQYLLFTSSLSAGKYLVQISSKDESIVKSIILIE